MQGGPIAGYQLVQQKLVDMVTEITKAQLLALRLGRLKDEGRLAARDGLAGQAQQRGHRARDRPRRRATSSAPTASSTSTAPCGTW